MQDPPTRSRRARTNPLVVALVLAGLVLVGAAATLLASAPAEEFGEAPPAAGEASGPANTREASGPANQGEAAGPANPGEAPGPANPGEASEASPDTVDPGPATAPIQLPDVTTRSARAEDLPRTPAPPVTVALPDLGITAPIDPVGLEPDRSMEIPDDVARVGWFSPGAAPGDAAGSAVLSGHVDSREQGPGALFDLRTASPGDEVRVTLENGEELVYAVTGLARYGKAELPTDELFRRDGAHRLVLITCGGAFDSESRSYEENVVVIAEPRP